MYPRVFLALKNYVKNRAHPECSIAEGYLAHESMTFCSRYLSSVETQFNRPQCNNEVDPCLLERLEHSIQGILWERKEVFLMLEDRIECQGTRLISTH